MAEDFDVRTAIEYGRRTGLYPASVGPGMRPSIDQRVNDAVQEVSSLPSVPYPSTWSVVSKHPGVLGYQVMTDNEYQAASKYDMLMRRLQAIQQDDPSAFRRSAIAQLLPDGNPQPIKAPGWFHDRERGADEPVPPYRHRGVFAPGQPGRTFMDLWMVPFSAVANNVIRPSYDLDKAVENQPAQLNNATGGMYGLVTGKDMNPAWSSEQRYVESQGFASPSMLATGGKPHLAYQYEGPSGTVDGPQVLEEIGYPDHWSRDFLGIAMEAPLDPATTSLGLMGKNLARAGRYASPAAKRAALGAAGRNLGGELAAPAVWTGVLEGARRMGED